MNLEQELAKLVVEMEHVKNKVDDIDHKLESVNLSSRLAVLEDRQTTIFRLIHGTIGLFGTVLSGIVIWLFTR
jgi:hypothetical protein